MIEKVIAQLGGSSGGGGEGILKGLVLPSRIAAGYSISMGKGLREPCSPFREAYVFGEPLNTPDASNWNCAAAIVEPTRAFDLSALSPPCEVVVALVVLTNLYSGCRIGFSWYRDRDFKLLFDFRYNIPDPEDYGYDYWEWYYVYCYIGYCDWEIWEDGGYHLDVWKDMERLDQLSFTVSGVEPIEKYSEISMVAPSSAVAGSKVTVGVKIKNLCNYAIYASPTLRYDSKELYGVLYELSPGETRSWSFPFTMPSTDITVTAESWCGSDYFEWHLDDSVQKTIASSEEIIEIISITPYVLREV